MSLDLDSELQRPARRRGYISQLLEDVRAQLAPDAYERLAGAPWAARELVSATLREANTHRQRG